jgi:hypothetical protein
MDELNRQFQTYITRELGESMKAIQMESGGRSRVEASGILFLRSLCRLTHTGHAQYAKGCERYELKIDYVAMDQVCTWSHYKVDILLYD